MATAMSMAMPAAASLKKTSGNSKTQAPRSESYSPVTLSPMPETWRVRPRKRALLLTVRTAQGRGRVTEGPGTEADAEAALRVVAACLADWRAERTETWVQCEQEHPLTPLWRVTTSMGHCPSLGDGGWQGYTRHMLKGSSQYTLSGGGMHIRSFLCSDLISGSKVRDGGGGYRCDDDDDDDGCEEDAAVFLHE